MLDVQRRADKARVGACKHESTIGCADRQREHSACWGCCMTPTRAGQADRDADRFCSRLDGGGLTVYTGEPPADIYDPIPSDCILACELRFADKAFKQAENGTATANPLFMGKVRIDWDGPYWGRAQAVDGDVVFDVTLRHDEPLEQGGSVDVTIVYDVRPRGEGADRADPAPSGTTRSSTAVPPVRAYFARR